MFGLIDALFSALGSFIGGIILLAVITMMMHSCHAHAQVYELRDNGELRNISTPRRLAASPLFNDTIQTPEPLRHSFAPTAFAAPVLFQASFDQAGDIYGLSPRLIEAVAWVESRFNMRARSPKGALGVMQLMPATAASLGVNARNAHDNIQGGSAYLRQLLNHYGGDMIKTVAAYNAGPGAVDRFGGVPPFRETRRYVEAIMARLASQVSLSNQQE